MIGSQISRYDILERLGEGATGVVYKARDRAGDRLVALVLLARPPVSPVSSTSPASTGEDRQRLWREARTATTLAHPNLCPLYDVGETADGGLFLALGFCPGETLAARLARRALPLAEALDLAAQIAGGLAAAHERGIVHQDLQPARVRISSEEQVQVVGCGLAALSTPAVSPYRAPEQLRGDPADARTDVWSLGVILYEMLAGKPLFASAADADTAFTRAIRDEAPVTLLPSLSAVPPAVRRIVERALAKSPAARYQRMAEMQADLLAVDAELLEEGDLTLLDSGAHGSPVAVPVLHSGRDVSHFRILEPLGGGGMGVVYAAEDLQLGRAVALKFLAPDLVRDEVGKKRFLTEARAASALDHPNLCTILEVAETEEGLLFLAMPRYRGLSLERQIARGPLPLEEALDIATQAARGLAKAHQHGIVHRDIKPANLFLTDDGVVKILDFGIAKLMGEAGPTLRGSLLGTPAYMAPEQTRGEAVDARADVWSLGVVLYEMLAGRRPFTGGTGAAVVYAVLHRTPAPLANLRPDVPPEVLRIVSRMLARDHDERYADAGELLADLRRAQGLASAGLSSGEGAGRRRWRWVPAAALALVVIAGIAGVAGLLAWRRRGAVGPQPTNAIRLTDLQGKETFPCLSPDGVFFVYAKSVGGHSHLFLQRVAGGSPLSLTASSPADDTQPAFSPSGQQIAFRSERDGGGIFLMGATGESVRRLTDFGFNPTWSPDGREIAVATEGAFDPANRESRSKIFRFNLETGARRALGVADGVQPSWSPHGWRIAYWGLAQPGSRRAIWTVPADGGAPVNVVDDEFYNWSPAWSPDGRFLYFASNRGGSMNLWRVPVDERSGEVLGIPQPITTPSEWSALPSFSRDGRLLLYATNDNRSFVEQVPFDPGTGRAAGAQSLIFEGARAVWACETSPDGTWLLFRSGSPQEDLLLIRPTGRDLRQLTNDAARDRAPHWSPDGSRILFSSNRSGKYEAWTIRPDGSGLTQITHLPDRVLNPFWAPDGRRISFTYGSMGTGILDLVDARRPAAPPRILPRTADGQVLARAAWSDDGRFLAGVLLRQDESPVPGIVLWSLADNTVRRLTRTGTDPVFFHGGRRVLFWEPTAIRLVDVLSGEVRDLLSPPPHSSYVSASVGPGDRTLCTVRITDEGDIWILSLVEGAGAGRP
jgi:eukaryotic-like serine/threonine-protein kinase